MFKIYTLKIPTFSDGPQTQLIITLSADLWTSQSGSISPSDRPIGMLKYPEISGFIQASLSRIQVLLKDFFTVFKDQNFMKNTDLRVKILLQKC